MATTTHHLTTRPALFAALFALAFTLLAAPTDVRFEIGGLDRDAVAFSTSDSATAVRRVPRATQAERVALRFPVRTRARMISYRSHSAAVRRAVVLLPGWYGPRRHPPLPLIISPHGRALDGEANAHLWGDLPAAGGFAVVSPDGEGRRLQSMSWGARGQIDDLARMPQLVEEALPWVRIDEARVYAVGGSMGGQETLLLVARHPEVLAGAAAIDSVTDFALQYRNFPELKCNEECRRQTGSSLGALLQKRARTEVGGTPSEVPAAFAERSAIDLVDEIAESCVPLQVWWSRKDEIVIDPETQSGRFVRELRARAPRAAVEEYAGAWIHTRVMRADRQLPLIVERFGLLSERWGTRPTLRYTVSEGVGCATG